MYCEIVLTVRVMTNTEERRQYLSCTTPLANECLLHMKVFKLTYAILERHIGYIYAFVCWKFRRNTVNWSSGYIVMHAHLSGTLWLTATCSWPSQDWKPSSECMSIIEGGHYKRVCVFSRLYNGVSRLKFCETHTLKSIWLDCLVRFCAHSMHMGPFQGATFSIILDDVMCLARIRSIS